MRLAAADIPHRGILALDAGAVKQQVERQRRGHTGGGEGDHLKDVNIDGAVAQGDRRRFHPTARDFLRVCAKPLQQTVLNDDGRMRR